MKASSGKRDFPIMKNDKNFMDIYNKTFSDLVSLAIEPGEDGNSNVSIGTDNKDDQAISRAAIDSLVTSVSQIPSDVLAEVIHNPTAISWDELNRAVESEIRDADPQTQTQIQTQAQQTRTEDETARPQGMMMMWEEEEYAEKEEGESNGLIFVDDGVVLDGRAVADLEEAAAEADGAKARPHAAEPTVAPLLSPIDFGDVEKEIESEANRAESSQFQYFMQEANAVQGEAEAEAEPLSEEAALGDGSAVAASEGAEEPASGTAEAHHRPAQPSVIGRSAAPHTAVLSALDDGAFMSEDIAEMTEFFRTQVCDASLSLLSLYPTRYMCYHSLTHSCLYVCLSSSAVWAAPSPEKPQSTPSRRKSPL